MRTLLIRRGPLHDASCQRNCPHWNGRWQSGASFHAETPARPLPGLAATQPIARRVVAAAIERNRS